MNIQRKARALASSLLIIAGTSTCVQAQEKHMQGWQLPPPGTAAKIKNARHAQIARRMAYNNRAVTSAESELDSIQANMWYNLATQPERSPWKLLMDSATVYGYQGYGYGVQNRPYPVYGYGGYGCVPMSSYYWGY